MEASLAGATLPDACRCDARRFAPVGAMLPYAVGAKPGFAGEAGCGADLYGPRTGRCKDASPCRCNARRFAPVGAMLPYAVGAKPGFAGEAGCGADLYGPRTGRCNFVVAAYIPSAVFDGLCRATDTRSGAWTDRVRERCTDSEANPTAK